MASLGENQKHHPPIIADKYRLYNTSKIGKANLHNIISKFIIYPTAKIFLISARQFVEMNLIDRSNDYCIWIFKRDPQDIVELQLANEVQN